MLTLILHRMIKVSCSNRLEAPLGNSIILHLFKNISKKMFVDNFLNSVIISCGMYYKHFYNRKFMSIGIVNAVACTINMIKVVIDDSINIV
jgi:hypothetical protein